MSSRPEPESARSGRWLLGLAAMLAFASAGHSARKAVIPYDPPGESAVFVEAPGKDLVEANCLACHSADYISTQPRGPGFGRAFWETEVHKMIAVYGAPIDAQDVPKIVDYLATAYGESRTGAAEDHRR
jgi:sulfite dehydrogenase (cytochrome) subunit B